MDDVQERLTKVAPDGVPNTLSNGPAKPSSSHRRRKGSCKPRMTFLSCTTDCHICSSVAAFLPSEHDALPSGVAFMVRLFYPLSIHTDLRAFAPTSYTADAIKSHRPNHCARLHGTVWHARLGRSGRDGPSLGSVQRRGAWSSTRAQRCVFCLLSLCRIDR